MRNFSTKELFRLTERYISLLPLYMITHSTSSHATLPNQFRPHLIILLLLNPINEFFIHKYKAIFLKSLSNLLNFTSILPLSQSHDFLPGLRTSIITLQ